MIRSPHNPNCCYDNLVKFNCNECNKSFILGAVTMVIADKQIICPYCHSEYIEPVANTDNEWLRIHELGCMAITIKGADE